MSFDAHKFLISMTFNLSIFSFVAHVFGVMSKNLAYLANKSKVMKIYLFYDFSSYIEVVGPFCVNCCVWYEVGVQ